MEPMNNQTNHQLSPFARFIIGSGVIGVVAPLLNWQIQHYDLQLQQQEAKQQLELKQTEMEQQLELRRVELDKQLEIKELEQLVKNADQVFNKSTADSKDIVLFFATVSRSDGVRDRWQTYLVLLENREATKREQLEKINQDIELKVAAEEQMQQAEQAKILALEAEKRGAAASEQARLEREIENQRAEIEKLVARRSEEELALSVQQAQAKVILSDITLSREQATVALNVRTGWIYLGAYDDQQAQWNTSYVNLPRNSKPENLENKRLSVAAASLNVRAGMPSTFGSFRKVIDVVNQSAVVEILEVERWQSTDYVWARIRY